MRLTAEEISPISQEEQKPSRVEGKMQLYFYWQTPAAAKLGEDLARLRHGRNEHDSEHQNPSDGDGLATVLSEQQRSTEAWEATLRDFLNRFEHWRRDHDEPPAAYFHMASAIFEQLIDLIPNRTLRGAIVRDFIAFLSQSPLEIENPPEWFLETRRLLGQVDLENEIRATGDRVMNLYLDLRVLSRR